MDNQASTCVHSTLLITLPSSESSDEPRQMQGSSERLLLAYKKYGCTYVLLPVSDKKVDTTPLDASAWVFKEGAYAYAVSTTIG